MAGVEMRSGLKLQMGELNNAGVLELAGIGVAGNLDVGSLPPPCSLNLLTPSLIVNHIIDH